MSRRGLVGFGLALSLLASRAQAEPIAMPADAVPCALEGLSIDNDPAGLNIRTAPSLTAKIIARLPKLSKASDGPYPELRIIGFSNGWFLIEGAHYGDYGGPPPAKPLYAGKGWAHGSKLGGSLMGGDQSSRLRTEPRDDAPQAPIKQKADYVEVRALLACKGDWVKVDSAVGVGWAYGLCGNQVTTCN